MKYRTLGRTGLQASEIGFGAWGIGAGAEWPGADREALAALNCAVDLGVNFFDTALAYGEGRSESLIGQLVRARSEKLIVCTKIPPQNRVWPPWLDTPLEEAFAYDYVIDTTNQNLRNLGLERIDVQLLHAWIDKWAESDELQEASLRLKREGKIGAFGVSMNFPYGGGDNAISGMRTGLIEVIEVVYNIHEQRPQYDVFPEALRHNVGVIARAPLNEGELSGRITPGVELPEGSFQAFYFRGDARKREVYERARTLDWLIREEDASLPEAALRFCLSQPAVSTVIVGMERPEYVRANVQASGKGPLGAETLERLRAWNWPHVFWQ